MIIGGGIEGGGTVKVVVAEEEGIIMDGGLRGL